MATPAKTRTAPAEPETVEPSAPILPAASDATPEEIDTVTMTGVTLAQLRAIRARDNIDADAIVAHRDNGRDPRADICGACFPTGWPNGHADFASCEHGEWTR